MNMDNSKDINGLVFASNVASVAGAVYLYLKSSRDAGIFVGLWAPTILGLGSLANSNRAAASAAIAAHETASATNPTA